MTVSELLTQLNEKNVGLSVKGDDLVVRGKEQILETPELLELLRKNKKALVEHIKAGGYVDPKGIVHAPLNRIPLACEAITPEMLPLVELSEEEIGRIIDQVPGGVGNVQDIYPLAPLQEGILFHHLLGREGDPYLLARLISFDSREKVDAYVEALQKVIERHDILRTAVIWEGISEPVQVVFRKAKLVVEEVELDEKAGNVPRQLYERYNPRRYRINVGQAPWLRIYLAQDRERRCWVMMELLHNLAGDHSTAAVMREEIQAHLLGKEDQLPTPLPFRNLVAQARLGVSRQEHEAFFRELLGEVDEPTAPYGLLDVQGAGERIKEARLFVEAGLSRRIRNSARKLGVSVASVCHVAWARVLGKISGREDVVFGTVLLGRMQGGEEMERAMGLFINTLPVRIRIGERGVERSVKEAHGQLADLMRHEQASLVLAQRCSGVEAPTPLFSSLLNYRHRKREKSVPAEAKQAWEGIQALYGEERTNYPLSISIDDLGEEFLLSAQASEPIDPVKICHYLHTALESLAEALENLPDRPVLRTEILPEEERKQLLYGWNQTQAEYPSKLCIHELFEDQVKKTPEAVALFLDTAALSYGDLNRRANQLAHYLRRLGVKPNQPVAVCAERSFEMVVGLLSILKAGGAYVPLDPAYPGDRLKYMLEDSSPMALLVQGGQGRLLGDVGRRLLNIDLEDLSRWQDQPETNLESLDVGAGSGNLAYLIYTSGSTGVPKGVMGLHRGAINRFTWMYEEYPFESGEVCCAKSSFSFVDSIWELFGPLSKGIPTVLLPAALNRDPINLIQALNTHRITRLVLVPSLLRTILEAHRSDERLLPNLKYWSVSGEHLPGALVNEFFKKAPNGRLLNLYGSSEDSADVLWYEVRHGRASSVIPIGRPIANTQVYILDRNGEPAPTGVQGELYIGGAGLAQGYLNYPDLTTSKFIPAPFVSGSEPGGRMYATGDLARWLADGTIEYLGRDDFQVKIRGNRVELSEVEARLAEVPGVMEAVVVARNDESGDKRLVAYYTCIEKDEPGVGAIELRQRLAEHLPDYMIPAAYVQLKALPLTGSGKLDRKALPAPEGNAHVVQGYEPPLGEIETTVARIWSEILKVERVGRYDNFFALGGHSLSAFRVMTTLGQMGIKILTADLFAHPTVESLSAKIGFESNQVLADQAVCIRKGSSELPLFLAHEGSGQLLYAPVLADHIDAEISIYGLPAIPADAAPLRTIEGMAMRMVQMIRNVQPVGPYRVAGWSYGGTLAYEIAVQLIGADQRVDFVGLLDTTYLSSVKNSLEAYPKEFNDKEQLLRSIQHAITNNQALNKNESLKAIMDRLRVESESIDFATLVARFQELYLLPQHLAQLSVVQIRQYLMRRHLYNLANLQYFAQPVPTPIDLFISQENGSGVPFLGWNSILPENQLRVTPIAGTHLTMMDDPNIIALGRALSEAISQSKARSVNLPERNYSPLISLQSGRRGVEPLYCIPGAGAGITSFLDLIAALPESRPVFGFQPRGLEDLLAPHSTVSAAVESYLQAILEADLNIPIHLLGHSFGGWVAFEIASRSSETGIVIGSLTILDSEAPDSVDGVVREYTHNEAIMEWIDTFEQILDRPSGIQQGDLEKLDEAAQRKLLHEYLTNEDLVSRRSRPDMLLGPLRTFARSLRTHFRPSRVYEGPVQLVQVDHPKWDTQRNREKQERLAEGWKRWAPNLFQTHAPGNHMTILKQPHVRALARLIQSVAGDSFTGRRSNSNRRT